MRKIALALIGLAAVSAVLYIKRNPSVLLNRAMVNGYISGLKPRHWWE